MKYILLFSIIFALAACSPSESAIQTAIAQTQAALPTVSLPTATLWPTSTLWQKSTEAPTSTSVPTKRPTITASPQIQKTLETLLIDTGKLIEDNVSDVDSITTIRSGNNSLEIELMTKWASKDSQSIVSFKVIQLLSLIFGNISEENALYAVSGKPEHFSIFLTTYSVDGDYKYSSLTYYDTLVKLYNKQITYDEWVSESGAGFIP